MRRKLVTIGGLVALLLATFAFATGAFGRQGRGGRPFGPPSPERMLSRMQEDLSLTDDQVAQVKAIMADEQSKTETYRTKMGDLDSQMRSATANGQFDEATVRGIATQQAAVMTEMIVERERGKSRTYDVLTPDQRTKFESFRPGGPPPPEGGMGFQPRP